MGARTMTQGLYRHFKGGYYRFFGTVIHSETMETLALYQSTASGIMYVRPYDMFVSKVDREKYPDAPQDYRFEQVSSTGYELTEAGCMKSLEESIEILEEEIEDLKQRYTDLMGIAKMMGGIKDDD